MRIRLLAATVAVLALAGCGGQSASETRYLANVHQNVQGMSDSTLLQAGHDFCDHHSDSDGGYSAIDYVGDGTVEVEIGASAEHYLCDG